MVRSLVAFGKRIRMYDTTQTSEFLSEQLFRHDMFDVAVFDDAPRSLAGIAEAFRRFVP